MLHHFSVVGRYRLLATVGHGGMSDVYVAAALGPAGFQKLLVVKELRPPLAQDPDFLSMFLDEARLAARLNHPNIVQTYEVFSDAGRYFIAMEYLSGQPLHRVLAYYAERDPAPLPEYLRILVETCAGLDYAHELKDYDGAPLSVVHRDVSPHNVFLTYEGQVKVVDFGVAKARDSSAESRVGLLKGKLGYMAPEQARGERIDRRADVFAVGVMLWELIAGRRMWRSVGELEVLKRLVAGEIPELGSVRSDVPEALERICKKALCARADGRYATAGALQHELELYLESLEERVDPRRLAQLVALPFIGERERMQATIDGELRRLADGTADASQLEPPSLAYTPQPGASSGLNELGREQPTAVQPATLRRSRWTRGVVVLGTSAVLAAAALIGKGDRPRSGAAKGPEVLAPLGAAPPSRCGAARPLIELSGDVEASATLSACNEYLLKFTTFVKPGVTLTIERGTTLRGDKETRGTLVVQPGGRLVAEGTRDEPVVFTSNAPPAERRPGDWGGLIVLGNAPTNLRDQSERSVRGRVEGIATGGDYGGSDELDDSGTLRYVRIEYSGIEIGPGNEINGLTLAGVGRKTRIDHVDVRFTADDCFEFFGGTVDVKYLICQHGGDDGFDWDLGYTGRMQFLVLQDEPELDNDSNGFEGDNDPNGSANPPLSAPVIYNATLCGKNRDLQKQHYGLLLRRGTRAKVANAIFTGFGAGLDLRDQATRVDVRSAIFFGNHRYQFAYPESPAAPLGPFQDDDGALDEAAWLAQPERNNRAFDPGIQCFDPEHPNFKPGRALSAGAEAPPDDGFFDASARYIGAFRDRTDDWDRGAWVVWSSH